MKIGRVDVLEFRGGSKCWGSFDLHLKLREFI
jgi:hypothetical protein